MASHNKISSDCIKFRKIMSAYVDNATGDTEGSALSDHVQVCAGCKRELANYYTMGDMIRSSYAPKATVDFSASIMMRLDPKNAVKKNEKRVQTAHNLFHYGVIAALMIAAIGSTVIYSQSQTKKLLAEKRKFDTYIVEHSEQMAGTVEPVGSSVLAVNFDR